MNKSVKKSIAGFMALVMISISTNLVMADTNVIENQNNDLLCDDVTSGSAIVENEIQLMSLLPLDEVEAALVLSDYTSDELKNMPVQKMLDSIEDSDGNKISIPSDAEIVMREIQNDTGKTIVDEYKVLYREGTIDLSVFENTTGYTMDLVVGDSKQLNGDNIRYIVKIYAQKDFDEVLDFDVYLQDKNGNREKIDCIMEISTEEKELVEGVKQTIPVYTLYPKKRIDTYNKSVYISINSLKEKHPNISVGTFVYDPFNYYETEKSHNDLFLYQDMTQTNAGFHMSRLLLPYNLDIGLFYNNDSENYIDWNTSKRNDFDTNVKNGNYIFGKDYYFFEFDLRTGIATAETEKPAQIGVYDQDGNWIDVDESYNFNMNIFKDGNGSLDVDRIITYYLKSDYNEDEEYYLRFNEKSIVLNESENIEKIVLGTYTKNDDISGLEDIKDIICGKGLKTKCNGDGLKITVLLSYGSKKTLFSYIFIANNNAVPEFSKLPIVGQADPYFRLTGVDGADSYVIENGGVYNLDTYYGYGYQTLLINDADADLSKLKPELWFAADDYFNLYKVDSDGSKLQDTSNPDSITKQNQQYALAWKNDDTGLKIRNYWLSVVKKTNDGAKLFVDGPDSGEVREVLLTDYFENKHDIFIANTGNAPLYVSARLSDDAKNVKLDDYWTVGGTNNQRLEAFTATSTPSDYSELDNVAKIRLLRPSVVEDDGTVSGKLIIEASGNLVDGELDKSDKAYEVYEIYLNDKPENPSIVNETLPNAVKYVPYQGIIATNNKYEQNIVTYKLSGDIPDGMTFNENTGELYGVPKAEGEYTFVVQANFSDTEFSSVEKTFTLKVDSNTDENVDLQVDEGFEIEKRIEDIVIYDGEAVEDKVFEFNYDYEQHEDEFEGFWLDGEKLVQGTDYTVEAGSTKITVKSQTISNTGDGTHTIAAEYRNKENEVKKSAQNFNKQTKKAVYNTSAQQTNQSQTMPSSNSGNHTVDTSNSTNNDVKKPSTTGTTSTTGTATTTGTTSTTGTATTTGTTSKSTSHSSGGGTTYYSVSFDSNGGTAVSSQRVRKGYPISFLATPAKPGYKFIGWYTDAELKQPYDKTSTVKSSFTLYAKYEAVDCKVWFNTNGGSEVNSVTVKGDTCLKDISEPTKNGYIFAGWYTDEKLTSPFDITKSITSNMTLYAKWDLYIPEEAPDNASGFIDVDKQAWYYNDVEWVYDKGYMVGYNNAIFAPNDGVSLSNLVTVLATLSGDDLSVYKTNTDAWYTAYINWAADRGLIETDEINPNKKLSREEVSVILAKFEDYVGVVYDDTDDSVGFSDDALISTDAKAAVKTLQKIDVIVGKENALFDPKGIATRAELAVLIHKLDLYNQN
jgi:uncharacterized repeat protein (TIGR02543 family)